MKLLLDTCTFLWVATRPSKLGRRVTERFQDPNNEVFLSVVSAWEIGIKHALGRLPLPSPPDRLIPDLRGTYGVESLPLDEESALHVARLPALHRDPFDRALVSQAIVHGLAIATPDEQITRYAIRTIW